MSTEDGITSHVLNMWGTDLDWDTLWSRLFSDDEKVPDPSKEYYAILLLTLEALADPP